MFFESKPVARIYIQAETPEILLNALGRLNKEEYKAFDVKYKVAYNAYTYSNYWKGDIKYSVLLNAIDHMTYKNHDNFIVLADYTSYDEYFEPSTAIIYYLGSHVYYERYSYPDRLSELYKSVNIEEPTNWLNYIDCYTSVKETNVIERLGITGVYHAIHQSDIDSMHRLVKQAPGLIPYILTAIGFTHMQNIVGLILLCTALMMNIDFKKKGLYKSLPNIGIIFSSLLLGVCALLNIINLIAELLLVR